MPYKQLSEVEERLNGDLALPVSKRQGNGGMTFDYVAWTDSYKLLNEVFGIFGWTMSQPVVLYAGGVYTVSLAITVLVQEPSVIKGVEGHIIEKTVSGIGQAVSRGDNDDNAAKSALSDALSRAVKMLGRAFGIELYEKKAGATPRQDTVTGASTTTPAKGRPSPKQRAILIDKCGMTEEQCDTVPFAVWKAKIDEHFASRTAEPAF